MQIFDDFFFHFPLQKTHVPYRDSKMTRILQESLGNNIDYFFKIIIERNLFI